MFDRLWPLDANSNRFSLLTLAPHSQAPLSEQIQQLQRELASQESVERNIEDNIRFRKQQQEIATFKSKEVTLQKELQSERRDLLEWGPASRPVIFVHAWRIERARVQIHCCCRACRTLAVCSVWV